MNSGIFSVGAFWTTPPVFAHPEHRWCSLALPSTTSIVWTVATELWHTSHWNILGAPDRFSAERAVAETLGCTAGQMGSLRGSLRFGLGSMVLGTRAFSSCATGS